MREGILEGDLNDLPVALTGEGEQHELRRAGRDKVFKRLCELKTATIVGVDETGTELAVSEQELSRDESEIITDG